MTTLEQNFKSLSLKRKFEKVKRNGRFVAERLFGTFYVQLYALDHFYAEVWKKKGLNHVYWIEVPTRQSVSDNYLQGIDIMGSIGLR